MTGEFEPAITESHKRALRALILGPDEEWEACATELLSEGNSSQGFSTLLAFSLGTMVRRKFSSSNSLKDVIQYVAYQRIKLDEDANELNPRLAENIIRFLLSDDSLKEPPITSENREEVAGIQQLLLFSLVSEADLDGAGVDALIHEAAEAAMMAS